MLAILWKREFRLRRAGLATILTSALALVAGSASHSLGQEPTATDAQAPVSEAAQALYEEALHHEMYGRDGERRALLAAALDSAPEMQAARWQLGQLQEQGQWRSYTTLMEEARGDSRLLEYQQRRAAATTAEDLVELARWCNAYGLRDRGRLHWEEVLRLDPSNQEAASRLGLIEYEGSWITRATRAEIRDQRAQLATADRAWRPRLEDCREALLTGDAAQRAAALEQLSLFDDEWAIPTLEELYLQQGGELALVAIELLSNLDHPWASESLAFLAMTTEETTVRNAAGQALRDRPLFTFVPQLVEGLQVPSATRSAASASLNLRTNANLANAAGNLAAEDSLPISPGELASSAELEDWSTVTQLHTELRTLDRRQNANIVAVLQAVIGRDDLTTAAQWQDWWSDYIFTESGSPAGDASLARFSASSKNFGSPGSALPGVTASFPHSAPYPTWQPEGYSFSQPEGISAAEARQRLHEIYSARREAAEYRRAVARYYRDLQAAANMRRMQSALSAWGSQTISNWQRQSQSMARGTGLECFVAGTLVWTETGARPIETLEIGDRVLAKNVETGELSFQLITARTEREAPETVTVVTGRETLVTTPGHLFWVSGQGWKMARELRSGDILHGADGADFVSEITFDPAPQRVYNLVIDQANTYFVGDSQLLVHDATSRQWSQALVPGLVLIED